MKIMTVAEAAAQADVSISAVRAAIRRGQLHTERLGKVHVITQAEYERWRENTRTYSRKEIHA